MRDKKAREGREKEGKNEREEEISERKRKESEIREREKRVQRKVYQTCSSAYGYVDIQWTPSGQ